MAKIHVAHQNQQVTRNIIHINKQKWIRTLRCLQKKNINEEALTSPGDCSFIFGSHSTISLSTLCSCAKQLTRISMNVTANSQQGKMHRSWVSD